MAIQFNDNIQSNSPKSLDNRDGRFIGGKWRPWLTKQEFLDTVNVAFRYETQFVKIYTNGVDSAGGIDTYWFVGGVLEGNLLLYKPPVDLEPIQIELANADDRLGVLEQNNTNINTGDETYETIVAKLGYVPSANNLDYFFEKKFFVPTSTTYAVTLDFVPIALTDIFFDSQATLSDDYYSLTNNIITFNNLNIGLEYLAIIKYFK